MDILSFFGYPSFSGVGIAVAFGLIWLAALGAWQWRGKWLWLSLAGVVIFPISIAWIQVPLQNLVNNRLVDSYGLLTYQNRILWMGIPYVLISGLVQEGAKLFPVSIYWWGQNRELSPKTGLAIGTMVGAGFGVCEAQWLLNSVFASGFTWSLVPQYGFLALLPFWERFFTVSFHIATGALSGYGLAKGKGWQFYSLASFLHFLANYSTFFYYKEMVTAVQIEIIIAVFSVIIYGVVLWLKWRHAEEIKQDNGHNNEPMLPSDQNQLP